MEKKRILQKTLAMIISLVVIIGLMAALTFALLDIFSPSIGQSARGGVGLTVGAGLGGGIPIR